MPVYAVGDVQGRFQELQTLLKRFAFDDSLDRLWLTGDLVNRGRHSAEVMRFVRDLGDRAVSVLGNHDLHLLAVAAGQCPPRRQDTFHDVLEAPDSQELLSWLRQRPLFHRDLECGYALVHAGLPPQWDAAAAQRYAREVEAVLRGPDYAQFLQRMYGSDPAVWSEGLRGWARLRFITNGLTRIRYCDVDGRMSFADKGPPGTQRQTLLPWFEVPQRKSVQDAVIFGHWATLQLHGRVSPRHNVYHLDTGCAWGGALTGMRLDDGRRMSVPCSGERGSKGA